MKKSANATVYGETMWRCINCGKVSPERPTACTDCGLVQAGIGTEEKYSILEDYCHPLSLIMRNNNLDHYFIDACAGSGLVQAHGREEFLDGSPLIMAKTRDYVENKIRDKSKEKHVQSIFLEIYRKTHDLLSENVKGYPGCEVNLGDCNILLPQILDRIESEVWKPFCFIYIDPFGLGAPVIRMETLRRVLERGYTELFLHLNMDALIRTAGWLKYLDSPDEEMKRKAQSYCQTIGLVLGEDKIEEFCAKWSSWPRGTKEDRSLEYYLSGLEGYYPYIEHIGIPVGSKRPVYYLVFTTRNQTGHTIMKGIMDKARRRGAESLEKWFKPEEVSDM